MASAATAPLPPNPKQVDYGSELAHVLEDYAARLQDAGNRLADMAAQLERKDALVQLVNEQLQEAARFAREETRLRQLAEAGKFEAEKKVHRALEQAAADRLCLARAEEELEELSRLPIQLSEHSRREWELTEKFVLLQEECATVAKNRDELAEQLAMLQATKDALEAELLNAHTRTRQAEMDMELYSGNLRDREENILARTRELEVLREQACKASEMLAEVEAENLALSRRGSEFTERVEALEEQLAERDARLAEARALADTHEERMAELRATMEARIQEERDALAAVTAQLAHANTELQAAHAEADEAARVAHERRAFLLGDVGRLERKVASLEKKLAEAGDALAVEKERVAATRAERDALAAEAKEEAAAASKQLAHQREETARAIRGYQEREKQLADEYGQELGRAREELRRTLKHTMDELTVEKKKVEQLEKQLAAAGDHRPHREEEKPRSPPLPVDERRELEALRKRVEQLETRNAALEKRHSTAHVEELERRHVEMSMRVVEAEEALKDLRVQLATACETSARDAARASQLEELLSLVGEGKADVVQELDRERIRAQVLQITATELADELEEQAVAAQRLLTEGLAEEGAARRQVEDTLALMIVRDKEKDAAIGALQREVDRLLGILERGGEPVPDGATLRPVTAEEKVHARAAAVKALRAAVQAALAVTRFASAGERGAQAATSLPMDTSPIAEGSASELEMESSGEAAGAGAVGKQGRRWSAFVPPREGIEAAAAADGARRGSADSLFRTAAHMAAVQQRIWQVTTKARQVGGFRRARQPSVTRTMLAQAWQKGELLPEEEPHVEEDEEEWEEGEGAVAEPATTATAAAMRSNNSKGKDSGGAGAKGGVGTGARVGSGVLPAVPVLGRREHALNVLSQMLEAANFYARHGMPPPTAEEALKRAASKTRIAAVATQATGDASTLARPGRSSMAKSSAKGRADAKSSSIVRTRSEASLQGAQRASVSSGSKPAAATTRTAQPSVSSRNRSVLFADSKAAHEVDGAQEGGGGTSPSTPLWGNASTGDHPPGATPSPLLLQSSARSSRSSSSPSASAEDAQASGDTATSRTRFADSPGDEATSAAGGGNARSMDAPPGTRQPSRRQSAAEEQAIPKAPLPLVLPRVSADGGAVGSDRGQAGGGGGSEGDAVANLLGELDQNEGEDGSPGEMVMRAPSRASVGRPGAGNAGARIQGHATTRAEHSEGAGQRKPSGWGRDAAAGKGGRAGANRHGLPTMTVRVDPSSGTMRLALPEHAWQVTEDGMLTIAPFGIDLSGTGVPLEAREGGAARGGAVNTGSEEGQGGRASGVPPLESEEWTRETVARVSLPWLHRPEKGPHRIELECKMVDLNLMSPRREFETSVPAHLGHLLYRMAGVP
eukprot:jgi/Mesvir1/14095/Mv22377-RA.2